jgi:hypothetical protein
VGSASAVQIAKTIQSPSKFLWVSGLHEYIHAHVYMYVCCINLTSILLSIRHHYFA